MYVRIARAGLMVLAIMVAATGIIAFVDPFGTSEPWLSWAVMVTFGAIASAAVIIIGIVYPEEFWESEATVFVTCGVILASILVLFGPDTMGNHQSVGWGGYLSGMLSAIITTLWVYLSAPDLFDNVEVNEKSDVDTYDML